MAKDFSAMSGIEPNPFAFPVKCLNHSTTTPVLFFRPSWMPFRTFPSVQVKIRKKEKSAIQTWFYIIVARGKPLVIYILFPSSCQLETAANVLIQSSSKFQGLRWGYVLFIHPYPDIVTQGLPLALSKSFRHDHSWPWRCKEYNL